MTVIYRALYGEAMLLPLGGAPVTNMAAGRKVLEKFGISFAIETKNY